MSSDMAGAVLVSNGPLELACAAFDATPPVGVPAPTVGENPTVRAIEGPLETRVFALRQGDLCLAFGNSDYYVFTEGRRRLAKAFGIPLEQTFFSITHNHSRVGGAGLPDSTEPSWRKTPRTSLSSEAIAWPDRFYADLDRAIHSLAGAFEPVTVLYGTSVEPTLTYNRKGRRTDGSSYFIREEDRVKLPADYTGTIDPLASLVRFDGVDGEPRLVITHFTGHPVISFQLEKPVINPDYCGWAVIDLLASFPGKTPVGVFLQGCAGDVNAKYMFGGAERARRSGAKLAEAFQAASAAARQSVPPRLAFACGTAQVPYGPLPPLEALERDRRELQDFERRVEAGDPNTLRVLTYNFSETMEMKYRRNLTKPLLRWTDWAIQNVRQGNSQPEESCPIFVQVVALGRDVALVFLPAEPFVGIGLSIRERSPFPLTVPAAYTNTAYPNYIGTSADVGDGEYMSGFYRQAMKPPFREPAGDVIADKAVELLNKVRAAI